MFLCLPKALATSIYMYLNLFDKSLYNMTTHLRLPYLAGGMKLHVVNVNHHVCR